MNRLVITSEYRFARTPDGAIWTENSFPYSYWQKYLACFAEVKVVARVLDLPDAKSNFKRVDGPLVSIAALPYYLGSIQILSKWFSIKQRMKDFLQPNDAVIMVSPSPISMMFEKVVKRNRLAYGVEVLGDPNQVFSSFGVRHPLRIFLKHWMTYRQKKLVANASAVLYVTQNSLQNAYPANPGKFSIGVSNVDLQPNHVANDIVALPNFTSNNLQLVSVGSLEQLYKGPDVLLTAISLLKQRSINAQLTWVGGGRFTDQLRVMSQTLGIEDQVVFAGQLTSADVREKLDHAHLFILPSRTEGLPRALVEAMARGLACIGSNVGGIPELLSPAEMFTSGNATELATLIHKFYSDRTWAEAMAKKNLEKSHQYLSDRLDKKRQVFFSIVERSSHRALE